MDLNKLKADLLAKKKSSKTEFSDLLVIYTGAEPKEYHLKLRDSSGAVILDDKGNEKRSSVVSGYTYTFNELGSGKLVRVVLAKREVNIKLLGVYKVSGFGYDIRQSSLVFIDEAKELKAYA